MKKGSIFIMPRSSSEWKGAEALWITVAGWSAAGARRFGSAWVITTDAVAAPEVVSSYGSSGFKQTRSTFSLSTWIPGVLKTLIKDILLWNSRNRKSYLQDVPWSGIPLALVWEQHDLFAGPGRKLAKSLGVPFVIFVHAPVVWEASRWGVQRPIWGKLLEVFSESKSLKRADLVACVSEEVAGKVVSMGVPLSRIVISPMSVDPEPFVRARGTDKIRRSMNLEGKIVIGWTGSFRPFHGLEGLVRAFGQLSAQNPNVCLLLVGDGSERKVIEQLVDSLKLRQSVFFSGKIPFGEIPDYVCTFDIAVVSTPKSDEFHYSPLKLREYLAARCAVVAPRAGEIPHQFREDEDLLLYTPGNEGDLNAKLSRLVEDAGLRNRIAETGHSRVLATGTWDHQLSCVMNKLEEMKASVK